MLTNLYFASSSFEPVFGWLEQNGGHAVEVWGLEQGRRMALLAYSDGAGDGFGWSDWANAAYEDPSQFCAVFVDLELVAEDELAMQLQAAFPDVFRTELDDMG